VDEALVDIRWRLRCLPDPDRDRAIRAAIGDLLDHDGDGRLAVRGLPRQTAVIWWEHGMPVSDLLPGD